MSSHSSVAIVSDQRVRVSTTPPAAGTSEKHTYTQILKSTTMIGGSAAVNMAFGIVRTKAMALFLGPAGVGLLGLYNSIADVAHSFAGMGVQSSGVRQIAEAVGSGEAERIARTATILRQISIMLGLIGAAMIVVLARPISLFTFGSAQQAWGVALLSLAVFCRLVSGGQGALIQGMRRISDLARMNVMAAALGTALSIPIIYLFRERGIVPTIIAVYGVSMLTSWWYSRQVKIERPSMAIWQIWHESGALLKLGIAFMASGFLTMGGSYLIRIIVLRQAGVEASGLYQAAWALGGLYVAFILQAMGSDFYPRLTAVAKNDAECNRLVNEQAQISLLLAGPGVIGTLTLAPLIIAIFYTAKFGPAVIILRWVCLGMMLRVIAWPMGFIILAKGRQQIFLWTELAATVVHVGLAWLLVRRFGLAGAGAAFFGLYVWHTLLIYAIVRRVSAFRWSPANRRLGLVFLPMTAFVFLSFFVLPWGGALALGLVAVVFSSAHSLQSLVALLPPEKIPAPIRLKLRRLGFRAG